MSDIEISLTFTGGALLAATEARAVIAAVLGPVITQAATDLIPTLIAATPRKTGALQGDYHVSDPPKWDGTRYGVAVYNERVYAPVVQVRGRSAGYADRGLAAGKAAAIATIKAGGPDLARALWVAAP